MSAQAPPKTKRRASQGVRQAFGAAGARRSEPFQRRKDCTGISSRFSGGVASKGAGQAAVFICLVPVFAVLQAAVLLDEHLRPAVLAGGLLVIAGVWLTTQHKKTQEKTA